MVIVMDTTMQHVAYYVLALTDSGQTAKQQYMPARTTTAKAARSCLALTFNAL